MRKSVTNFEVYTENKWTPFSMTKNAQKTVIKVLSKNKAREDNAEEHRMIEVTTKELWGRKTKRSMN